MNLLTRLSRKPGKPRSKPNRNPPNVTWQHSWSSSETANGLAESRFRFLPPEVLLQIFKGLSVHDLGNISLTCRALKIIADQDDIWKLKCKCKFLFCGRVALFNLFVERV